MGRIFFRLVTLLTAMAMFFISGTNAKAAERTQSTLYDRCRIVFAEAGLEPKEGQIAVAAVIRNREESDAFPDDFYEIITQENQFSSVVDGEIYNCGKPVEYDDLSPEIYISTRKSIISQEDPTEELLWAEAERLGLDPEYYAAGGALYFYSPSGLEATGSIAALEDRAHIKVKVQIGNHIFYKVWDKAE